MSVVASAWAWRTISNPALEFSGTHKLILLAYADIANELGVAFPSHDYIARMVRCSKSSVRRALRDFEAMGFCLVQETPGRPNRITFNLGFTPDGGGQPDHPTPVNLTRGGGQPDHPGGSQIDQGGVHPGEQGGVHPGEHRSVINHQDPTLPDRLEAASGRELEALARELGNERLPYETDERLRSRLALAVRSRSAERAAS